MRQLLNEAVEIHVYKNYVDMRKSYDGLFKLVENSKVFAGGVFLFFSKNRKRAKALVWNENGLMIVMQRMEHGCFADITRRRSLSRDEFLEYFEGSKIINKIDGNQQYKVDKSVKIGDSSGRYKDASHYSRPSQYRERFLQI